MDNKFSTICELCATSWHFAMDYPESTITAACGHPNWFLSGALCGDCSRKDRRCQCCGNRLSNWQPPIEPLGWWLSKQCDRPDAIGELAVAMRDDTIWPGRECYKCLGMEDHIAWCLLPKPNKNRLEKALIDAYQEFRLIDSQDIYQELAMFTCPICDQLTLQENPNQDCGTFEICYVCHVEFGYHDGGGSLEHRKKRWPVLREKYRNGKID